MTARGVDKIDVDIPPRSDSKPCDSKRARVPVLFRCGQQTAKVSRNAVQASGDSKHAQVRSRIIRGIDGRPPITSRARVVPLKSADRAPARSLSP